MQTTASNRSHAFIRARRSSFLCALALITATAVSGGAAHASDVVATAVTVTTYIAYTDFGNGDVIFVVSAAPSGCGAGFWLPASAAGFKTLFATLVVAYTTKASMSVDADPTQLWPGSSGQYCRVTDLQPE